MYPDILLMKVGINAIKSINQHLINIPTNIDSDSGSDSSVSKILDSGSDFNLRKKSKQCGINSNPGIGIAHL